MPDTPDWQRSVSLDAISGSIIVPISISASSVTLPINITSSSINVPIAIAAASVTIPINITSTSVNVPISIAAASVNVPISIAATTVTVPIQISSQVGNVNVNLAATAITQNVSITASSVTLNENITGQTVAIYSGSQYAPVQGSGVNQVATVGAAVTGNPTVLSYTVPAAKTFYLQGMSWVLALAAGCSVPIIVLRKGGVDYHYLDPRFGSWMILDTPFVFPTGTVLTIIMSYVQVGGTGSNLYANLWGWTA